VTNDKVIERDNRVLKIEWIQVSAGRWASRAGGWASGGRALGAGVVAIIILQAPGSWKRAVD
jgi:hypothetical protein